MICLCFVQISIPFNVIFPSFELSIAKVINAMYESILSTKKLKMNLNYKYVGNLFIFIHGGLTAAPKRRPCCESVEVPKKKDNSLSMRNDELY